MTVWAIVPVKPLRRGKSRLADILPDAERAELNRWLLEHTLSTLADTRGIEETLVISRDPEALALARDFQARTLQEDASSRLNNALTRATAVARMHNISGVLILPADLPLVAAEDVENLLEKSQRKPGVVIAPDRHEDGTNALLVRPAGLIEYEFGPHSFQRHCERARKAEARLEIVHRPALALDLDLPEDLELVRRIEAEKGVPNPLPVAPELVKIHVDPEEDHRPGSA
jgi:2-phospho-L-lactate guanylyltransferase